MSEGESHVVSVVKILKMFLTEVQIKTAATSSATWIYKHNEAFILYFIHIINFDQSELRHCSAFVISLALYHINSYLFLQMTFVGFLLSLCNCFHSFSKGIRDAQIQHLNSKFANEWDCTIDTFCIDVYHAQG